MQNFVAPGNVVTVPAPADTQSGAFVMVGSMFGVASSFAANGSDLELFVGGGVFDVTKVSAQGWAAGNPIYWDATAMNFTTVSTNNTKVGVATAVAANPSTVGRVRLNGAF